ncbi:MAG: tetratricopeptide repeat protein [Treponema sp.]|nr:tetratricopeptide repeat protein [Treponema sp.]
MKNLNKKVSVALAAVFVCGRIFAAAEKTASDYYNEGLASQNNENWYEASQHYMEAIQKNPVYSDAWFHIAECSYQLGEFDLVLSQLDEAEKYAKDDNSINNLRGMTYIAMQQFVEARKIFEKILKKTPNDVDARFGLAELDLFDGRISGAERQYSEALKRQSENRKALLSLAVVSSQLGKTENSQNYIKQALLLYSNEPEVHYIAAVVAAMNNELKSAEAHCRIAVQIDGNYEKAYELLAKIRYAQKEYEDVISLCDFIIGRDRNNSSAWYLKGAALNSLQKPLDAISVWTNGLKISPQDEIMRAALEIAVNKNIALEDSRRADWALYHVQTAREYARRYESQSSIYEYQRALKIEPANKEARIAFASILELNGMHELYLEQLLFIKSIKDENSSKNLSETELDDKIEAYENLLQDSLAKKWNVEPFYLDKNRWSIGIYFVPGTINQHHIENNRIAAEFASDIFSGLAAASVSTETASVSGFGDAYQKARTSGKDYFILISVDEGARDVTLDYTMYSARTGSKVTEDSLYGTGNNRYSGVFRRFRDDILNHLPIRGKIIDRDGKTLLSDLGRSENVIEGSVFDVVRKNSIQTASSGSGVTYKDSDILGTFTVTTSGEEISEGLLEYRGFYDRVNTGDELVLISRPKTDEENAAQIVSGSQNNANANANIAPQGNANGESVVEQKSPGLTAEDLGVRRTPAFIDLVRSIY